MRNNKNDAGRGGPRPQIKAQYRDGVGPRGVAVYADQVDDHITNLHEQVDAILEVMMALPYVAPHCSVSNFGIEALASLARSRLAEARALRGSQ